MILMVGSLAFSSQAIADPPAAKPPAPTVYVLALPAAASLVAFLPVEKSPDRFDLDLRVEVVLGTNCGDKVAGLMKRNGATLDGDDAYDVVLERKAVGECKKDAARVGTRWAIRTKIADGATRSLSIGERTWKVARAGDKITLDGEPATGDVPGAPPTAKPATFVTGEVTAAKELRGWAVPKQAGYTAVFELEVSAKLPKCAAAPIGLLARGDASTKFALTHFEPLAIAPLDGSCTAQTKVHKSKLLGVWRGTADHAFTVGKLALSGKNPPLEAAVGR
jgi:hypothetical protein